MTKTFWIDCECKERSHAIRFFNFEESNICIYMETDYYNYRSFSSRLLQSIKYIFNYIDKYGIADCTLLSKDCYESFKDVAPSVIPNPIQGKEDVFSIENNDWMLCIASCDDGLVVSLFPCKKSLRERLAIAVRLLMNKRCFNNQVWEFNQERWSHLLSFLEDKSS